MGLNTVAVLRNDFLHDLAEDSNAGPKIVRATNRHSHGHDMDSDFHYGQIISIGHADAYQVVIVHGNTGQTIYGAANLPFAPLDAMAACLAKHGWKVVRPTARKRKKKEPPA